MNRQSTYGGDIELRVAARLYPDYKFHVYQRGNTISEIVYSYGYGEKKDVFLVYSGNHYDLLHPDT